MDRECDAVSKLLVMAGSVIPEFIPSFSAGDPELTAAEQVPELRATRVREISGKWWRFLNPVTAQVGPSCAGHGFANAVEAMLRRFSPTEWLSATLEKVGAKLTRWQIDGEKIHRVAREHWYGGNLSGGLKMSEVAQLHKITGLLGNPDRVEVVQVKPTWERLDAALQVSPILIGLFLSETWLSPDPFTGWIKPAMPNPLAGHLLCGATIERDDEGNEYLFCMNSWGSRWGRYGYACLNLPFAKYSWIDSGVAFVVPPGWWQESTVADWVIA